MDLTFPPALCFRVMNQLLTLTGTWRKGGGQKKMLQQLDVHADAHARGLGGRSLHAQGPCGVRRAAEPGGAANVRGSFYQQEGDAVNNLKSTWFSNCNSHLYPLLGCC